MVNFSPEPGAHLLAHLEATGIAAPADLRRAQSLAAQSGEALPRVLNRLGIVSDPAVVHAMSEISGAPVVELSERSPDTEALEKLGFAFVKAQLLIPLRPEQGDGIDLAAADPTDGSIERLVQLRLERPVRLLTAGASEIEMLLERLRLEAAEEAEPGGDTPATDEDLARLKDQASEAPVVRLVNAIVRRAVELRASDIHLEPHERDLRLRYRVDGALREADAPPAKLRAAVISRLKIMARLDIAESRLPQDGRIKTVVSGRELDLRVATTPTLHGEGMVIRLLDRSGLQLDFEGLGFDQRLQREIRALIERPNGIALVTGPTGSGKTTTLYAALSAINDATRKIITVEDPVEYQMPGVSQIQVHSAIGLGFAEALRSILRQDPDIIMIGEIRDLETARIAVQAALTGHLVLATLHTNSAAAAIDRLRDMGVPDYLLTATVNGAAAQRLVRRLCPDCAEPDPEAPEMAASLGAGEAGNWLRPVGCSACAGTGYRGRTTLLEILRLSSPLKRLVLDGGDEMAMAAAARAEGMRGLLEHGLARAAAGETSLAEVIGVAGASV